MSEVKRWDISYSERYGLDKEQDPNGEYVEWKDHAAAIAAKDAEIAQLRRDLKLSHAAYEQCEREITELRAQPARQIPVHGLADAPSQVEAAIVAIRDLWDEDECPPYPVVAKAIRRLLPAQPARQVGGDEREAAIAQFALTLPMTSESAAGGNTYDQELRRYYLLGWDDRAALAPAAVVMPEKLAADSWGGKYEHGYNFALDVVARLNRRVIPVGLLEKLAHCTDPDCCIAHARGELRALLGKEVE